ncbi:MAG: hypothetical protein AVDCRST_MAG19-593, partial [uncultured Thermomicrobiales bacterium]
DRPTHRDRPCPRHRPAGRERRRHTLLPDGGSPL